MNTGGRPTLALLALAAGAVPFATANAAYVLSALAEQVPWCVPYAEGCTSISRAGRAPPAVHLFRPVMIAAAGLAIACWLRLPRWAGAERAVRAASWLGVLGGVALVLYVIALGVDTEPLRSLRRYGAMVFFAGTGLAQVLIAGRLARAARRAAGLPTALRIMVLVSVALIALGWVNAFATRSAVQNAIEWSFAALLALNFLLLAVLHRGYPHGIAGGPRSPVQV